jgi:diadenosine tetraphosphate (Ap4A) HIT family hydrolase
MKQLGECPFCSLSPRRIEIENGHAFAIRDAFPISPGHTLVIPRRHIRSWFEATSMERDAILTLLDTCKRGLDELYRPDAYNIGINDGPAAGQTIAHLHAHLIPRYLNDVADPRGGIRWLIPAKAAYWSDDR